MRKAKINMTGRLGTTPMKRQLSNAFSILALGLALSAGIWGGGSQPFAEEIRSGAFRPEVAFEDHTVEIVTHAERLIAKNEREGGVFDQKWYGFRRFGDYQKLFLGAENVLFYGGLEADVYSHIRGKYLSVTPLAKNRDPGEVRLFVGRLDGGKWDCIVIGQNGREVALKTVIRLLYMAKFADDEAKRTHRLRSRPFKNWLKVYMSPVAPRTEYLAFFKKHGIRNPDVVMIGFMGDASLVLAEMGFPRPETFSDESLRALWYPNVNGKKVLLISINGNRIFSSRSRDLMEAIYDSAPDSRPLVTFFGSAGAIDAPDLVGNIVAPTRLMNADPFPRVRRESDLVHLVRNRAVDLVRLKSTHASVESVVVETTEWAKHIKKQRVNTVDQELYHIIDAIHGSRRGAETDIYAAVLVTDNVPSDVSDNHITLEAAEETIAETATLRQDFLLNVFRGEGILTDVNEMSRIELNSRAIPSLQ
ncbi:MAG: hypothetical protein ACREQ2_05400 [Candidatus Binatia bacterium]